jgi:acyl carrier protein
LQQRVNFVETCTGRNILNANYDDVLTIVVSIIDRLLKGKIALTEDTAIQADAGMTSLHVMEMVLEVEESFDISFPLNRLPDIRTIRDLCEEVVAILDR